MDLLWSLKLPHWLMVAGAGSIVAGLLGLVFTRNKQSAANPNQGPPAPRPQMPPLLSQPDSTRQQESD